MALSDEEFEDLVDFLDAHSPFDADGVLGLFHAIASAPGIVLPSAWLPRVVTKDSSDLDVDSLNDFVGLMMCLYNEVIDVLEHGAAMAPEADDIAGCESFAAGYVTGAELDPRWIGDDDRWTFAAPLAYLAGRRDLVPAKMLADIERQREPDPKVLLRRQLGSLLVTTHRAFEKHRRATAAEHLPPHVLPRSVRVGRNEPCPCGSGKKYKRCCAGRTDSAS
jgi:uncharacterized protein